MSSEQGSADHENGPEKFQNSGTEAVIGAIDEGDKEQGVGSDTDPNSIPEDGGSPSIEVEIGADTTADPDVDKDGNIGDPEGEQEEEEEEQNMEDVYNPNNLLWDELEMLLYEWEPEATSVKEYLDWSVIEKLRKGDAGEEDEKEKEKIETEAEPEKKKSWSDRLNSALEEDPMDLGGKTSAKFKKTKDHYFNFTNDAAHVVEFYAPWCPHCQNYKWVYVEIAEEVKRRSTFTPVEFHAVSCDVYYDLCATYEIEGFPTILGWRQGQPKTVRGIELNADHQIFPEQIAKELRFDLAQEEIALSNQKFTSDEERLQYEEQNAKLAKKAAEMKTSWHEYQPNTHNDRFHNAALSLVFAVKSQLFQILTADGEIDPKRRSALIDFLNLLDWATPQSWGLRKQFVQELQWNIEANLVKDRSDIESLIESNMKEHRAIGGSSLWGSINNDYKLIEIFSSKTQEQLTRHDKHWTKTCTHSQPGKGFTCGLWNLFHIISIGVSKPDHELYGFHRGYFVSPHDVANTMRNFVEYFFSCDVCRTNFLAMYDSCGHDHCNRLTKELTMGQKDENKDSRMELSLWLWEVHNSVNVRLMKEAAQRQDRPVSHEETLSSMFPTLKMCPDCWLDSNMTNWNKEKIFDFLNDWYWPKDEHANSKVDFATEKHVSGNTKLNDRSEVYFHNQENSLSSISEMSFFQIIGRGKFILPFVLAFILAILATIATCKSRGKKKKVHRY